MMSPLWRAWSRAVLLPIGTKTTLPSFAFLPQYFAFRTISSLSPILQDLNLNGPVPVGCLKPYDPVGVKMPFRSSALLAPYFLSAFGLAIAKFVSESAGMNGPNDFANVITAVDWPRALQLLYRLGDSSELSFFLNPRKIAW